VSEPANSDVCPRPAALSDKCLSRPTVTRAHAPRQVVVLDGLAPLLEELLAAGTLDHPPGVRRGCRGSCGVSSRTSVHDAFGDNWTSFRETKSRA
jgi:hypothetical protein